MMFKSTLLFSLCLILKITIASESITEHKELDRCKQSIVELIAFSKKVVEKNISNADAYSSIIQEFVKKYKITFSDEEGKFVFRCCIPSSLELHDVEVIDNENLSPKFPAAKHGEDSLQDFIYNQSITALSESCKSAIKMLNQFAIEQLKACRILSEDANASQCKLKYDPETPYDSNLILLVNWLIKLAKSSYCNLFLYNYDIFIELVSSSYIYEIVFNQETSQTTVAIPNNKFQEDFCTYYHGLSNLSFKELSEYENTEILFAWALNNSKPDLASSIVANKDSFDFLFDTIRKERITRSKIKSYACPCFLFLTEPDSKLCAFKLSTFEKQLLESTVYPKNGRKLISQNILTFLYSPKDLSNNILCKNAVEREIAILTLISKYAQLCFLSKKYDKLCEILNEHTDKYKINEFKPSKFTEIRKKMREFFRSASFAHFFSQDHQFLGCNAKLTTDTCEMQQILDSANSQELEIMHILEQDQSEKCIKAMKSFKMNDKLLAIQKILKLNHWPLKDTDLKYSEFLYDKQCTIGKLKNLENEHEKIANMIKLISKADNSSVEKTKEMDDYITKLKELEREIEMLRLCIFENRQETNEILHFVWVRIEQFLQILKNY